MFSLGRFVTTILIMMKFSFLMTAKVGSHEYYQVKRQYRHSSINITSNYDVCNKPICIHAASNILRNMDLNLDPCDDFYQFVCKKFIENTKIPNDESDVTIFSVLNDKLEEQVHDVLDSPITEDDIRPFRLAKNLYKTCMNKSLIEKTGDTYIKSLFMEFGGWPVIEGENWDESHFDWKESIYTSARIGLSTTYFFDIYVHVDFKNSSAYVISVDQPALSLDREYLVKGLEDNLVSEYYKYMVDIAVLFGADRENATKELKQALEFEIALANITLPSEELRDSNKQYNPMTISELQTNYSSIPWLELTRTLLSDETIGTDEVIIIYVPSFIKSLEILLNNTSKRVLANYALGRVARTACKYLSSKFYNRRSEYHKIFSGSTEQEPRWKECVRISDDELPLAVAALYVRKYFSEETKNSARDMVNKIKTQVYEMLENVEWMDNKTRAAALAKAKAVTTHIGYPDELRDDSKLEKYYESLEFDPYNFYGAILNTRKFERSQDLKKLHKSVNKTDWVTHTLVTEVNARYDRVENSLILSAGILQGMFFNKDFPLYINYGGIGTFIGHEITHGFDDQGSQFDKDGNLINWWEDRTKKQYLEKASCIVHQYGNYTVQAINMNLNGINTQGENIADNGGYKEAYLAYIKWAQENGQEQRLLGLEKFSPQQMFWISAASSWCSVSRPEALRIKVKIASHAPNEFRVIGPLSNQEHFSRDFECPIGSNMNPINKCSVW